MTKEQWPVLPAPWGPRVVAATISRVTVSPFAGVSPSTPSIYEIVPVLTCLPVIDNTVTIKSLLLSGPMKKRVNGFYRRHRLAIFVGFFVGLASVGFGGMASVDIARPAAVVSCVGMIPGQLSYMLEMRYQFIKLLVRSFEFWYTTTLILLWTVSGATMYSDVRICSLLMPSLGMELQLLGDACTRPMRSLVASAMVSVALCGVFMTSSAFGLMDQIVVLRITASLDGRLVVSNRDIFINTTLPLMILGTRLGYSKYQALKYQDHSGTHKERAAPTLVAPSPAAILPPGRVVATPGVRCMAYRCKLKLQIYTGAAQGHSRHSLDTVAIPQQGSRFLPLRAVRIRELFHVGHTVIPWLTPRSKVAAPLRLLHQITGLTGLLATAASFYTHIGEATDIPRTTVALVCTSAHCGYYFCVSHRRLLRALFRSFDFVFVLVQLTLELVAVAHLYGWHTTVSLGGVLPCWLWIWHVMTLDTVTPRIKQLLGLRVRYFASPVLLLFMVGQVALAVEVLVYNHLCFEDRVFVQVTVGAKMFQMKAASFALSRAITSFVWSARLLWRIWSSPDAFDSTLVMLQGHIEFDYVCRGDGRSSRVASDL